MTNQPHKILILDDEAVIGLVVRNELRNSGYEAHHILLKTKGYDWILENQPDLIISDIKSPGMDGFQLLRWLKANPKTSNIPFIYCTGYADLKNAIYSRKLGASDFVAKPFDILDLFSTIARVLDQDWHPNIHSNRTDESELQFLKWEQLCELFRLVIDTSSVRMTEVKESNAWDIYFIFEQNRKLYGGLFTKPLEYNTLSYQDVYLFREWLDEQMIDIGIIMGFYKRDEDVNNLAGILGITILQKNKTEDILKGSLLINKTGNKKSWFENVELKKSASDLHKKEIFYALLDEVQDLNGKNILFNEKTFTLHIYTNGISFISGDQKSRVWVDQTSLLRILTRLLVYGFVRKNEFELDTNEMGCVFQLLSCMPSLKIQGDTISLQTHT